MTAMIALPFRATSRPITGEPDTRTRATCNRCGIRFNRKSPKSGRTCRDCRAVEKDHRVRETGRKNP